MSSPSSADQTDLPPPASLAIHLDLLGGLAGDMFVAAMVDALPALAPLVLAELAAVQPAGTPVPGFFAASAGGLRARRFGITPTPDEVAYRSSPARQACAIAAPVRAEDHAGTAYPVLRRKLVDAPISAATREQALALLALLADAEAHVHGTAVDNVHFHELADWDSLMDLVAAGCIAATLADARWTASAPPLGGGNVRTAHGLLPVPAPATAFLLTGYPWHDDGVSGERVTPTGAAILRHLVPAGECNGRRDAGRLVSVGSGAGTRALPGLPNIARVLVFERALVTGAGADADVVSVLEFDVDDMTGEEIAIAGEHLRTHPGVIDVSIGTRHGKKGRPLADFRVLGEPHATAAIARACFSETSTLGMRVRDERRQLLRRAEVTTEHDGAAIRVKLAERPGGARTAKAAHDDVASELGLDRRRATREAAVRRALKGGDK